MKKTRIILFGVLLSLITSFTGCALIDDGLVKLGFHNDDFDYIKENKIDKIIIQSARDSGFSFVVTDTNAIDDIYNILKKGNLCTERTSLDTDYIFEVHMGDDVKKYNYAVYLDEKGVGNFYDDSNSYKISNNLDETILQNLSFVRKPRDFEGVYYDSILKILEMKKDILSNSNNKVGIDIAGDVDCLKYMFSVDLESFKKDIDNTISGTQLINNNSEDFNTIITVKNKGYSSNVFKTTINVDDRVNKVYETYYIQCKYEYKKWNFTISEPNKKPSKW